MMTKLSIGSTVWVFDENRRVYRKGERGGPIYREHFRPVKITGETSRSWVLVDGRKINKKTLEGIYPTEADVDRAVWINDHRYKLSRLLGLCRDYDKLRAIAEILDYEEQE